MTARAGGKDGARRRRSAYDLAYAPTALAPQQQRQALLWWQQGTDYHPLRCPVCAARLEVAAEGVALRCPTAWCSYTTSDIPWGVYAAWRQRQGRPERLLFLPGAAGRTDFWQPLVARLRHPAEKIVLGWPGFGPTPPDPRVASLADLVDLVLSRIERPTALIAQSMGGVVALRAALARPELITHLVLCVTSGGLDTAALGAADWRPVLRAAQPQLPDWFADDRSDLSAALAALRIPTLLLFGDADPLSPVAIGERLAALLPDATLHVLTGGDHDLACTLAAAVAPLIDAHLGHNARV